MDTENLRRITLQLVEDGKGILAIDESPETIQKKFDKYKINNTPENRRIFRKCLIETDDIEKYVSGVIFHTETYFQRNESDVAFYDILKKKGILTGIKLDQGLEQIDYDDVKIKASKTAKMINEKIPSELKEGVKSAGEKLSNFLKKHTEQPEVERVEEHKVENHGEFIKFCSSENFDDEFIEKVPKGIDELKQKLECGMFGQAQFAKWRSLFTINRCTPTFECIDRNCEILAKYAHICQEHNLVPILEPEILFNGSFSIEEHYRILKYILSLLINKLNAKNVDLNAILLKIGFVTAGSMKPPIEAHVVAEYTNDALLSILPRKIPGIVFLSGGHTSENSMKYLQMLCKLNKSVNISFSFGRALTDRTLEKWNGNDENVEEARKVFLDDCMRSAKASEQKK